MSRRERDKGRKAEAEVAAIYQSHGFAVRGLEGVGDHLAVGHGLVIHSEVKRQEVLRLPLWTRQALAEAPADALPIVAYRRNRSPWRAVAPEDRVAVRLGLAGFVSGCHYSLRRLNGVWFAECELQRLLAGLVRAATPAGLSGAPQ